MTQLGRYAATAERTGFESVGVIDRLGVADAYIRHYYGPNYFPMARADTLTSAGQILAELAQLSETGCTEVVFYPCSGGLDQVELLGQVLTDWLPRPVPPVTSQTAVR